jgi:hypothetical protein
MAPFPHNHSFHSGFVVVLCDNHSEQARHRTEATHEQRPNHTPDFIGRHNLAGSTWNRDQHKQYWTRHRGMKDVIALVD